MARKMSPNSLKNLEKRKPFTKGDPRINRAGRVSSFDQLREYLQAFLDENVSDKDQRTKLRELIEEMAGNKQSHKDLLEFAFGKVPLSQIIKVDEHSTITWKEFINGYGDTDSDPSNEKS